MKTSKATRISLICAARTVGAHTSTFGSNLDLLEEEKTRVLRTCTSFANSPTHILCAPEVNAIQTASLITQRFTVDQDLAELDVGRWKGQTLNAVAASEPENLELWVRDPSTTPHGGEAIMTLLERARLWLDARHCRGGKHLAIVNQSMIRAVILAIVRAPAQSYWCLDLSPLSRTEISSDGRRWAIRAMGVSEH